jgi:hypothetical protein
MGVSLHRQSLARLTLTLHWTKYYALEINAPIAETNPAHSGLEDLPATVEAMREKVIGRHEIILEFV